MVRVLIADDHPIVRGGLKELLVRHLGSVECSEAANAEQVLTQVHHHLWDVLILDISMPGRSGLDVLSDLRLARPKLPILALSVHPEEQYATRVLKAGARGYLNKESTPEELIQAVRHLLAGHRYVSPALAEDVDHGGADALRVSQSSCGLNSGGSDSDIPLPHIRCSPRPVNPAIHIDS